MTTLDDLKRKWMGSPAFKKAYDDSAATWEAERARIEEAAMKRRSDRKWIKATLAFFFAIGLAGVFLSPTTDGRYGGIVIAGWSAFWFVVIVLMRRRS